MSDKNIAMFEFIKNITGRDLHEWQKRHIDTLLTNSSTSTTTPHKTIKLDPRLD